MIAWLIFIVRVAVAAMAAVWSVRQASRHRRRASPFDHLDRAKTRALTKIVVERLLAEERLRYLIRRRAGQ